MNNKKTSKNKTLKRLGILLGFSIFAFIPALAINYSINGNNIFDNSSGALTHALTGNISFGDPIAVMENKTILVPTTTIISINPTKSTMKPTIKPAIQNQIIQKKKELVCENWRELEQGSGKVKHCTWE